MTKKSCGSRVGVEDVESEAGLSPGERLSWRNSTFSTPPDFTELLERVEHLIQEIKTLETAHDRKESAQVRDGPGDDEKRTSHPSSSSLDDMPKLLSESPISASERNGQVESNDEMQEVFNVDIRECDTPGATSDFSVDVSDPVLLEEGIQGEFAVPPSRPTKITELDQNIGETIKNYPDTNIIPVVKNGEEPKRILAVPVITIIPASEDGEEEAAFELLSSTFEAPSASSSVVSEKLGSDGSAVDLPRQEEAIGTEETGEKVFKMPSSISEAPNVSTPDVPKEAVEDITSVDFPSHEETLGTEHAEKEVFELPLSTSESPKMKASIAAEKAEDTISVDLPCPEEAPANGEGEKEAFKEPLSASEEVKEESSEEATPGPEKGTPSSVPEILERDVPSTVVRRPEEALAVKKKPTILRKAKKLAFPSKKPTAPKPGPPGVGDKRAATSTVTTILRPALGTLAKAKTMSKPPATRNEPVASKVPSGKAPIAVPRARANTEIKKASGPSMIRTAAPVKARPTSTIASKTATAATQPPVRATAKRDLVARPGGTKAPINTTAIAKTGAPGRPALNKTTNTTVPRASKTVISAPARKPLAKEASTSSRTAPRVPAGATKQPAARPVTKPLGSSSSKFVSGQASKLTKSSQATVSKTTASSTINKRPLVAGTKVAKKNGSNLPLK